MDHSTDIDIMLDGLKDRWRSAAPWVRVRMVYAALSGLHQPDEATLTEIVKEATTPFERLGLLFLLGPRPDLIAQMEHPDERAKAARILRWMRKELSPAEAWILESHGPPPASIGAHPVLDHASPGMLAAIIAPALVNAADNSETKRLAERCLDLLKQSNSEESYAAFGVGLARHGAWRALERASSHEQTFKRLFSAIVLYTARSPERIAQCADYGVFNPLFTPTLTSEPKTLAAIIRNAGVTIDQWTDNDIQRLITTAIHARHPEPITAAIAAFGPHSDLLTAAAMCGAHNDAMRALAQTTRITLDDIDRLTDAPWTLAHRVGHHPKLLDNAIKTRNADAYAVAFWDRLSDDERRKATLATILGKNPASITNLMRVPFESALLEPANALLQLPSLEKPDTMAPIISALRERADRYGRESVQTALVHRIRDALMSSAQGDMLWIASGLPLSPDDEHRLDDIIRRSAMDIARLASAHHWPLASDRRDAIIRAIVDTGDPDMAANATNFLGWDQRLIDAALAPSDQDLGFDLFLPGSSKGRADLEAQRALTCIRGIVSANAWNDVPEGAAVSLITVALRDPACDPVKLIEACGPLPILISHVLIQPTHRAKHISPISIARAMHAHGDIPDHHRNTLASRCLNNSYAACDLAAIIGHHPRLEQIARTYRAIELYYDSVFKSGRWDDSLLNHPEGRQRIVSEAANCPATLHAFTTMPLTPSVFLSALSHPSLLAARIAVQQFPETGSYADAARVISACPSNYLLVSDESANIVDMIMSHGDPVSRAAFRDRAPTFSAIVAPTATDHADVAVHLAKLLQRPRSDDIAILALLSTLRSDAHGLDLLVRVAAHVGHCDEIARVFRQLSPEWLARYKAAVGDQMPDIGQANAPIAMIQNVVARRHGSR